MTSLSSPSSSSPRNLVSILKYKPNARHATNSIKLWNETGDQYWSERAQKYIELQRLDPNKHWIYQIIFDNKEQEFVKMRNHEFIILPDIKNKYKHVFFYHKDTRNLNWMVIITNPDLRSIRDLRKEHLPLLERIKKSAVEQAKIEYPGIGEDDIMIYANYPPSIQVLHFHVCFPFLRSSAFDAFHMHSIDSIINNLRLHEDYYRISNFLIPIHERSPLMQIYKYRS
jgi:hypothetical protein